MILNILKTPIYFQNKGSLLLFHPRDKGELTRFLKVISPKIEEQGIQSLSQAEIKHYEPAIEHFHEGYYLANEGQIDSQSLLLALKAHLLHQGLKWHKTTVQSVKPHIVISTNKTFTFDLVFDCRGLRSPLFANDLRGIRGELLWLHHPNITIHHPIRLLHPRYKIYLSPRPDHLFIVGASEIEAEDMSPISVKTILELLSAIYYIHASFTEARLVKTLTHCRPTLKNHLPKIKWTKGLLAINGLYRHGFLIAPAIAFDVIRYITQGFSSIHFPTIWEELYDYDYI